MRCEVCGAPLRADRSRCRLCEERRLTGEPHGSMDREAGWRNHRGVLPLPPHGSGRSDLSSVVLEGKYRLINEIGRGAMGSVFVAEDQALRRNVAIKFLLPELTSSVECARRFEAEAIGMAAIRDPNVVQIYTYGVYGETPYFAMEYLDGETVETLIDSHNSRGFFIALDEVFDIMIQSLNGLAAIHRAGAVHRDIKPANIMLSGDPARAVIMDFGLVRLVRMEDDMRALAGTPAYIAPELVEGRQGAERSHLTDIYSMGVAAYELLTGTLPFGGETWVEILRKHITEIPAFPSERRAGLPEQVDEIIMRALSKDPKERYQSCDEFLTDIYEVKQELSAQNRRPTSVPPGSRGSRPRISTMPPEYLTPSRGISRAPTGNRGRLLVADENAEFRALVHGTAKASVPGCRVASANDGAMALRLIEEFQPHVVVLDLSLREVNGLEVIATIRGDSDLDHVKLLVVSDRAGEKEAAILAGLGVEGFLTKPIDPDGLAEMLRPMLESSFGLRVAG